MLQVPIRHAHLVVLVIDHGPGPHRRRQPAGKARIPVPPTISKRANATGHAITSVQTTPKETTACYWPPDLHRGSSYAVR